MKRALISVYDKTNVVWFAEQLHSLGYEIISTGGTSRLLEKSNIPVISVEEITGVPELLDGRVKTLHPMIHGGLLSRRDNSSDLAQLQTHSIQAIDLVCVNLYPFREAMLQPDLSISDVIEQIDIGGPAMLRSAAKNHTFVTAVSDVKDYQTIIDDIETQGDTSLATRQYLAAKVFRLTASYDALIGTYLNEQSPNQTNDVFTLGYSLFQPLRYGENPHQSASLYQSPVPNPYSLFAAKVLHGKPLSYNNVQDANAAINILREHINPTVVGLKHMNPCGVATASSLDEAFDGAYQSDSVSIFGGIVACNRAVTASIAVKMADIFLELIIAPQFDEDALVVLKTKKNLRLLQLDTTAINTDSHTISSVNGGLLVQEIDHLVMDDTHLTCVTEQQPTPIEVEELLFAWKVVKHVKSNAIVVTKGYQTVGIGAGQMNRVGAAKIALSWAKEHNHTANLILASDAFLPFDDVVRLAAAYGVTAIIQPGGSIRDKDSIRACNELGITMVFTGHRHFKH